MLTLFCLARGSERFHKMFLESSLYQKTVGAYERDKAFSISAFTNYYSLGYKEASEIIKK